MHRFEDFVSLINGAYKGLQKIKSYEVESLGLKGGHVMCVFYLGQNEAGLTSGELCEKCREDKAAISRTLKYLYEKNLVVVAGDENKKYRLKNVLTDEGKKVYNGIEELIIKAEQRFSKGVSNRDRQTFYKVLGNLVKNFDNFCESQDL